MKTVLTSFFISTLVLITACESKWQKMPDDQLAAKSAECASIADPSSAMIQVCKNYQRECERRRKNNIYVC